MPTYTRLALSGSTNGKPIAVAATAIASGTTIHTAVAGTAAFDEIYLWVTNTDSVPHQLTVSWGATATAGLICVSLSIPANSPPIPIAPGLILQNGLLVLAAADSASKLNIEGFINRIQ